MVNNKYHIGFGSRVLFSFVVCLELLLLRMFSRCCTDTSICAVRLPPRTLTEPGDKNQTVNWIWLKTPLRDLNPDFMVELHFS